MNKMKTLTLQGIPFEVVDEQARNDIEVLKENGGASSWNDLKDKPFYEETEVINEPLNITWDGNTEGLVAFEGILYKVSDAILSNEQIKNATISMSDGITIFIGDDWDAMNSGGMITDDVVALIEGLAVIVRVDGAIWRDRVFPEAGIYFIGLESIHVSSLAVPAEIKTTVHKLDKKYLPDDVGGGVFVVTATQGSQEYEFIPDCSYEEARAAALSGKLLALSLGNDGFKNIFCSYRLSPDSLKWSEFSVSGVQGWQDTFTWIEGIPDVILYDSKEFYMTQSGDPA